MPTLDDQIRNILEAESPREDDNSSTSSSEGMKPAGIERPISPGVASDSIAQGRSLSRKRASIRLEFSMSDDNIEAEPGSDASWVVEQQNCAYFRDPRLAFPKFGFVTPFHSSSRASYAASPLLHYIASSTSW